MWSIIKNKVSYVYSVPPDKNIAILIFHTNERCISLLPPVVNKKLSKQLYS